MSNLQKNIEYVKVNVLRIKATANCLDYGYAPQNELSQLFLPKEKVVHKDSVITIVEGDSMEGTIFNKNGLICSPLNREVLLSNQIAIRDKRNSNGKAIAKYFDQVVVVKTKDECLVKKLIDYDDSTKIIKLGSENKKYKDINLHADKIHIIYKVDEDNILSHDEIIEYLPKDFWVDIVKDSKELFLHNEIKKIFKLFNDNIDCFNPKQEETFFLLKCQFDDIEITDIGGTHTFDDICVQRNKINSRLFKFIQSLNE